MSKYVIDGLIYSDVDTEAHPRAVSVTDEQVAQIEARTHYVNEAGEVVPIEQYLPTLADIKSAAIATLHDNALAAIADGVTVTLPNGGGVYVLAGSPSDQEQFTKDSARIAMESQGGILDADELTHFKDNAGALHALPTVQYAALLGLYGRAIRRVWEQLQTKSAEVMLCDTEEEVGAIDLTITEIPS